MGDHRIVLSLAAASLLLGATGASECTCRVCTATNTVSVHIGTTLPLYYRTRFAPTTDTPGTYSLVVRLTLVGA